MAYNVSADYTDNIAFGDYNDRFFVYKFGRIEGVSATDGIVPVWNGGSVYNFPSANALLSIVSTSADDAIGQGGATELTIQGLVDDGLGNWNDQEEVVTLTGLTPVISTKQFIRVNRMFISAGEDRNPPTGTTGAVIGGNHGIINVTHQGTGQPVAKISANQGQTLQAIYTLPSGYEAVALDADANIGEAADGVFGLYARRNITGNEVFRVQGTREAYQTEVGQTFKAKSKIIGKTDLMFLVSTSKINKNASATFQLLVRKVKT